MTGRPEVWGALRNAVELLKDGDLATAQGILDAAGVTLPTGNLTEGAFDEAGNLYRIPDVVLKDPENIVSDTLDERSRNRMSRDGENIDGETIIGQHEGKKFTAIESEDAEERDRDNEALLRKKQEEEQRILEEESVKVRCRLSDRGGPDVVVLVAKNHDVSTLLQRIKEEGSVRTHYI